MSSFVCPACRQWQSRAAKDRAGRERRCRTCRSLERHRTLALLLPALGGLVGPGLTVDVAPVASLEGALRRLPGRRVGLDFDPAADGRAVDVRASITDLPFAGASVQLILCSHVLEHVPDDRRALREFGRVLAPTGVALVAVPIRAGRTEEDPAASAEERVRRFGQADHVRYYGLEDFDDRLREAGLGVDSFTPADLAPPELIRVMRLVPSERFWLLRAPGAAAGFGAAELGAGLRDEAWSVIEAALGSEALARLAQDGDRIRRHLDRIDVLRRQPAVRVLLAARRRARRAARARRR